MSFLLLIPSIGFANIQYSFTTSAISVSQKAGSILIPVTWSGTVPTNSSSYVGYNTQNGTAVSGSRGDYGYVGGSLYYDQSLSGKNISVPIYYTGATTDHFFTVNLGGSTYNATIGSPSSVTVTILAESPTAPVTFYLGSSSVEVGQTAGAVQIPVYYTGTPSGTNVWVNYHTQSGTANGYDDYDGTSSTRLYFAAGSNSSLITIPIYSTGSAATKFFNVVLDDESEGQLGTPAAALVTILGKGQSPHSTGVHVTIRTKSAHRGTFRISGKVVGVKDSQIRRVSMTIGGNHINVRGKQNWSAAVYAPSRGNFLMIVHAYLKGGGTITARQHLHVR